MTRVEQPEVQDGRRPWSVFRCNHGCYHVQLEHVTLTFRTDEFQSFLGLLREASVKLGVIEATPVVHQLH